MGSSGVHQDSNELITRVNDSSEKKNKDARRNNARKNTELNGEEDDDDDSDGEADGNQQDLFSGLLGNGEEDALEI